MKRRRHFPAVAFVHCNLMAISELLRPSADQSTTFARATIACGKLRESARLLSWMRSSSLRAHSDLGRPMGMPQVTAAVSLCQLFLRHDTRRQGGTQTYAENFAAESAVHYVTE